jgi:hypothetical protein
METFAQAEELARSIRSHVNVLEKKNLGANTTADTEKMKIKLADLQMFK